MRGIIAEVSSAENKEEAFYQALMRLSGEGVDISGMLGQFGALGIQLLSGAKSADELYAALAQLENLNALQLDLEKAGSLSDAAKAIDPSSTSYDPLGTLEAYALLEAEYTELASLQRGSAEYIQRARELTDETTAAVYRQAAAYGVVIDVQAKSAQYAASGRRERQFKDAGENYYSGGVDFLSNAVRQAEEAGEDIAQEWNRALTELDDAGILSDMAVLFGDISLLVTKSILDAIIIMVMSATMGKGCIFSAIPVALFQGLVTLFARFLQPIMTAQATSNLALTGSILVFCVGVNLVWDKQHLKVANMLPTLIFAVALAFVL